MADFDQIYAEVVDGLIDNSRVNDVPIADDGWNAELAIETYYDPAGMPWDDNTRLIERVTGYLTRNWGRRWPDQID